jgi:hypothetical protein
MDRIIDINYVSMNDNLLDITIHNIKNSDNLHDSFLPYQTLFVKIDVRGNVSIKKQYVYRNWLLPECCVPHRRGTMIEVLTIKDDIEIPDYVISFIKTLLIPNQRFYLNYYNKIVESIQSLKHTLRLEFSDTYYNDCFSEIV